MRRFLRTLTPVIAVVLGATAAFAQDGKLSTSVTPKEAYVFVDGNAIHEGNYFWSRTVKLSAGKHTVVVANYGYKPSTQDVNIEAKKTTKIVVKLDPVGATVAGPYGKVQFTGVALTPTNRAAVLSNGTTPGYFVGHVDEFNHEFIWRQDLLMPPGTFHFTVTREGKTIWAGDVNVAVNKRVIVDVKKNAQKTVDWKEGEKLKDLPRFKSGVATTRVVVAPATGSFSAAPTQINCGQSSTLTWQTAETVDSNITNVGAVAPSGSQSVSPRATTTYDFLSTGPGGKVTGSSTVNVNTTVVASINASPTDLQYLQMGDKVITNGSSTVSWQTSNADNVTVNGQSAGASGSQTVTAQPSDTSPIAEGGQPRSVDQNKTVTLNATNVCGGSSTQTATIHITGSVEPVPAVPLQSVFYPTAYPDKEHPQVGLVRSQQLTLANVAAGFKKYLVYDPDAKLSIEAYADIRGPKPYNQDLSERRVERIKQYLVDQGISADKIETAAYGKERPLDQATVGTLQSTNPNPAPKALSNKQTSWLAYNRRADIVLLPSGKKSTQFFPNNADDAPLIWQRPKPPLKKVEADQ
ncbi:MAG TPA: OmpA family protein [Candidatus Acidoferrales bacterium]|nr:OmpA family protein [Candidatus Acidoferrales bacterium]